MDTWGRGLVDVALTVARAAAVGLGLPQDAIASLMQQARELSPFSSLSFLPLSLAAQRHEPSLLPLSLVSLQRTAEQSLSPNACRGPICLRQLAQISAARTRLA